MNSTHPPTGADQKVWCHAELDSASMQSKQVCKVQIPKLVRNDGIFYFLDNNRALALTLMGGEFICTKLIEIELCECGCLCNIFKN